MPPRSPSSPLSELRNRPALFWIIALAGVLMIVGGFGPWATALNFISVNGTRGDGWYVIVGGVVVLLLLWLHVSRRARWPLVLIVFAGGIAAAIAGSDLHDLNSNATSDFFGQQVKVVDPAWGVYMAIIASTAAAVFALALIPQDWRESRGKRAATDEAGWYVDPIDKSRKRYWDGERWTDHTSNGGGK